MTVDVTDDSDPHWLRYDNDPDWLDGCLRTPLLLLPALFVLALVVLISMGRS